MNLEEMYKCFSKVCFSDHLLDDWKPLCPMTHCEAEQNCKYQCCQKVLAETVTGVNDKTIEQIQTIYCNFIEYVKKTLEVAPDLDVKMFLNDTLQDYRTIVLLLYTEQIAIQAKQLGDTFIEECNPPMEAS